MRTVLDVPRFRFAANHTVLLAVAGACLVAAAVSTAGAGDPQDNIKEAAIAGQNLEKRARDLALRIQEVEGADVDDNSKLSKAERTAYLVALTMSSPDQVLEQYPAADHDEDGELSEAEALELIRGERLKAELEKKQKLEMEQASEALDDVQDKAGVKRELKKRWANSRKDLFVQIIERSEWLFENIESELTSEDVAQVMEFIKKSDRSQTLQKHPEADLDGDGQVSAEEAQKFKDKLRHMKRAKLLTEDPEADEDGDGTLSGEEQEAYSLEKELAGYLEENPEADSDGDGELTFEEFKDHKDAQDESE